MNKKIVFLGLGAVVLMGALGFFAYSYTHRSGSSDIASLARGGASEAQLLDAVDHSTATYGVTPDDIITLHKANVSDKVIIAMIQKNAASKQLAKK
jgi:hypothetical protein